MSRKTIDGVEWRVDGKAITRHEAGEWVKPTRAELLAHPADGPLWTWLREHGVWRPTPSGPTQADSARSASGRARLNVWFYPEELAALERLREGRSVRDTLAAVVLEAAKKRRP